jgi:hypothetical protein
MTANSRCYQMQVRVLETASALGISIDLLEYNWYTDPEWDYKGKVNQFVGINDCIYRYRYRFKHIAIVDTDEFISPRSEETLAHYLGRIDEHMPDVSRCC